MGAKKRSDKGSMLIVLFPLVVMIILSIVGFLQKFGCLRHLTQYVFSFIGYLQLYQKITDDDGFLRYFYEMENIYEIDGKTMVTIFIVLQKMLETL